MHFFCYVSNLDKTNVDDLVRARLVGFHPLNTHPSGLTGWYLENMYGDDAWFARPEYFAFLQAGGALPKFSILMAGSDELLLWDACGWESVEEEPGEGFVRMFCVSLPECHDSLQSDQTVAEALQALQNYHSSMLARGYRLITPGIPH
jgi:hypothetical protein